MRGNGRISSRQRSPQSRSADIVMLRKERKRPTTYSMNYRAHFHQLSVLSARPLFDDCLVSVGLSPRLARLGPTPPVVTESSAQSRGHRQPSNRYEKCAATFVRRTDVEFLTSSNDFGRLSTFKKEFIALSIFCLILKAKLIRHSIALVAVLMVMSFPVAPIKRVTSLRIALEHQVTAEDAMISALGIVPELMVNPGCKECSKSNETYCLGRDVIYDHCCCDRRFHESIPYVEHSCYIETTPCEPIVRDCGEYMKMMSCCCHRLLGTKWKNISMAFYAELLQSMNAIDYLCHSKSIKWLHTGQNIIPQNDKVHVI
ncbi:hypothetical protein LSTR_LSTR003537 [Laodelphax striatellus]|uniref:CCC domain-containing protein n=1 Tax=Laodelphax striatellus TaxID=195883 RepID=A0A482WKR8_LAOST|nr:hypothetical protein LSTR_LSTR003537 [Laodelphax striatellus]